MIKKAFITPLFILLLSLISTPMLGLGEKPKPSPKKQEALAKINNPAPIFEGITTQGTTIDLRQFKGQPIILEWKNHECPFVIKHYQSKNMQQLQQYAKDNNTVWISIISSAPGKQGYVSNKQANLIAKKESSKADHIILDTTGSIGQKYNAKTTPHMFLINENGKLVYQGAIDSIRSANPKDILSATNYVKQALDELLNNQTISIPSTKAYGCSIKY